MTAAACSVGVGTIKVRPRCPSASSASWRPALINVRTLAAMTTFLLGGTVTASVAAHERSGLAAGNGHSCAVDTEGQVHCWGLNDQGQADPPREQFVVVAAGDAVSCALNSGNRVACWGRIFMDSANTEARQFVTLSAAGAVCGLTDTRGVACWGTTSGRFFDLPPSIGDRDLLLDIAVGNKHACAIHLDGSVDCWGDLIWADGSAGSVHGYRCRGIAHCGVRETARLPAGGGSFKQSSRRQLAAVVPLGHIPSPTCNHWRMQRSPCNDRVPVQPPSPRQITVTPSGTAGLLGGCGSSGGRLSTSNGRWLANPFHRMDGLTRRSNRSEISQFTSVPTGRSRSPTMNSWMEWAFSGSRPAWRGHAKEASRTSVVAVSMPKPQFWPR